MANELSYFELVRSSYTQDQLDKLNNIRDLDTLGLSVNELDTGYKFLGSYLCPSKLCIDGGLLALVAKTGVSFVLEFQYDDDTHTGRRHRLTVEGGKWWCKSCTPVYNWDEE